MLAADLRDSGDGRELAIAKVVARLIGLPPDDVFRRAQRAQRRRARFARCGSGNLGGACGPRLRSHWRSLSYQARNAAGRHSIRRTIPRKPAAQILRIGRSNPLISLGWLSHLREAASSLFGSHVLILQSCNPDSPRNLAVAFPIRLFVSNRCVVRCGLDVAGLINGTRGYRVFAG